MTKKLPPLKCLDCGTGLWRSRPPPERCWRCHTAYRRTNAVTLDHKCIDCGVLIVLSAKDTLRCRPCFDEEVQRQVAERRNPASSTIFHAPHGPIRVPEGHSVYWVRKGEQL